MLNVNQNTLRRLITSDPPRVSAPSFIVSKGSMSIYCFTPKDVEEIKNYYKQKYDSFPGPGVSMPKGRPRARKPDEAGEKSA